MQVSLSEMSKLFHLLSSGSIDSKFIPNIETSEYEIVELNTLIRIAHSINDLGQSCSAIRS